jgi:membrane protease YdiL (CAAX protease family)
VKIKKWIRTTRKLIREYPVPGSIAAVFLALGLSRFSSQLLRMLPENILRDYLTQFGGILSIWLVVWFFGYQWCYRRGSTVKTILAGLPLILLMGFMLISTLLPVLTTPDVEWLPAERIVLGILKLFEIGFLEESLFRGITANCLGIRYGRDTGGIWFSVIVSGFIFGAAHMMNASIGVNLLNALAQSVTAWVFGMYFAAIYFRGGNIWVMIFIHSLTDSSGLFHTLFTATEITRVDAINQSGFQEWYFYLFILALTVLLLRKSKMSVVITNLHSAATEDESFC